jgi:hypothetical protein
MKSIRRKNTVSDIIKDVDGESTIDIEDLIKLLRVVVEINILANPMHLKITKDGQPFELPRDVMAHFYNGDASRTVFDSLYKNRWTIRDSNQ